LKSIWYRFYSRRPHAEKNFREEILTKAQRTQKKRRGNLTTAPSIAHDSV